MLSCKRIAIFGDAMLDRYLFGAPKKISDEAPIPVIQVTSEELRPGGAANVAANIASLGGEPIFVGLVGEDSGGYCLKNALEARDVSNNWLLTDSRHTTTVKTRLVSGVSQVARYDRENNSRQELLQQTDWHEIVSCALVDVHAVVISDYDKGFCTLQLCETVVQLAKSHGVPVIVDPKSNFKKYAGAFAITPNKKEAEAALGETFDTIEEAKTAARTLRKKYRVQNCIITLGPLGLVVATKKQVRHLPTVSREVFDVTGAGDTVVAAIAVRLAAGDSLEAACEYANAAAAVQVAQIGTAQITHRDVLNVLAPEEAGPANKIVPRRHLLKIVERLRANQARIGFTNGCFDLLHAGHVSLLEAARKMCDVLIVGVNDDASVQRLKGPSRPHNTLSARQAVLAGLASVSYVIDFTEDTPLELIQALKPDLLLKGQDYAGKSIAGADVVTAYGGKVHLLPFVPELSSTQLLAKLKDAAL
jgi:D-beta-D-heptose 7-phosphate kinase/D-beta-D-heptose 1-phosphate adenosyltransferase